MRKLYHQTLTVMENAFQRLEQQVPPPQKMDWGKEGFVFRYKEKSIEQALLLKLARTISGLHAVDILLVHGLLQEQAAINRILDEIQEDILFLAAAITNDQVTDRHKQYLSAFYAEAFSDPNNSLARSDKPNLVPRTKIRSYVNRVLNNDYNPSLVSNVGENISTAYSGFIHASSPQIMEMYEENPPHFLVSGMLGTPRMSEHIDDIWNYFYRGLLGFCTVAKAYGDKSLVDSLNEYIAKFEKASGTKYMGKAKE